MPQSEFFSEEDVAAFNKRGMNKRKFDDMQQIIEMKRQHALLLRKYPHAKRQAEERVREIQKFGEQLAVSRESSKQKKGAASQKKHNIRS